MRLTTSRSPFAAVPQKDLRAIVLHRGVSNIATIKTERWRLFRDKRRR